MKPKDLTKVGMIMYHLKVVQVSVGSAGNEYKRITLWNPLSYLFLLFFVISSIVEELSALPGEWVAALKDVTKPLPEGTTRL